MILTAADLATLGRNRQRRAEMELDNPEPIATYGPCCQIIRIGVWEPGTVHDGACRNKHGGNLGPTIYLYPSDALAALVAERDRLREELAAAQKDAKRYRWLRSRPEWLGWDSDFRPDEVEREIDAAMAKEKRDE